jgi:hypothetical protein
MSMMAELRRGALTLTGPAARMSLVRYQSLAFRSPQRPLLRNISIVAQAAAAQADEDKKKKADICRQPELIKGLAERAGVDTRIAKAITESLFTEIAEQVAGGKKVVITGKDTILAATGDWPHCGRHSFAALREEQYKSSRERDVVA